MDRLGREMEMSQNSLLEQIYMAPMEDSTWNSFTNELFPTPYSFNHPIDQTLDLLLPDPSILQQIPPTEYNGFHCSLYDLQPSLDAFTSPELSSIYEPNQQLCMNASNCEVEFADNYGFAGYEDGISSCNIDNAQNVEIGDVAFCGEMKKPERQNLSKNLMAERRRRKRLNDRLSLLRSIVPKVSKMDRTSIVGDAIDYMRELLDKINKLREEGIHEDADNINLIGHYLKELKPNQILGKNNPKFDVKRSSDKDTLVDIRCAAKPGLLLSTLGTLDALGLDVRQCVISCFNDFSVQASCHEAAEHRSHISSEDAKQALFRNAGYGGRCL